MISLGSGCSLGETSVFAAVGWCCCVVTPPNPTGVAAAEVAVVDRAVVGFGPPSPVNNEVEVVVGVVKAKLMPVGGAEIGVAPNERVGADVVVVVVPKLRPETKFRCGVNVISNQTAGKIVKVF